MLGNVTNQDKRGCIRRTRKKVLVKFFDTQKLACENSRPSSLPARVGFHSGRERRRTAVFAGYSEARKGYNFCNTPSICMLTLLLVFKAIYKLSILGFLFKFPLIPEGRFWT